MRTASRTSSQPLPHSEESERAVLASALLAPVEALPLITSALVADDFYLERHQLVYQAMVDLQEEGTEIDLRTLQALLEQRGAFDKTGGMAYLAGLDLDLPDLGRVETYVRVVKDRAMARRLITSHTQVAEAIMSGEVDLGEALRMTEQTVAEVAEGTIKQDLVRVGDSYEEEIAEMERKADADGALLGISTGWTDVDRLTQGLIPGNLVIVAGRPGMGKSCFGLNLATYAAVNLGKTVGVFSLEMSRSELIQRLISAESDIPLKSVRSGRLTQQQWMRVYEVMRLTAESPLYLDDSASMTLLEICSKARRMKHEKGLDLVVVDYLQLMTAGARHENRQLEIAAISRRLKQLAKELDIPVVALSQLSRNPEHRGDHRPQLADLRESGAIEQDADMVCFIYRDELYNKDEPDNKGLGELIVAKHRNGPTGTVELVFLGETVSFRSYARDRHEPEQMPF